MATGDIYQKDCPHCGRCPVCGRRTEPYNPYPIYPWYPTWEDTGIITGADGATIILSDNSVPCKCNE